MRKETKIAAAVTSPQSLGVLPQAPLRPPTPSITPLAALTVRDLCVTFGDREVLRNVSMDIQARAVTAIIGPSGCGKSTFLRALNRLHELALNARMTGIVRLFGDDIYARNV